MPADDPEKLLASANGASGPARTAWLAFLGLIAYLLITLAGVSHVDLLLNSPVTLPIVGVDIPLFSFFLTAPFLFLLVHLGLLVQHAMLAHKYQHLNAALEPIEAAGGGDHAQRKLVHYYVFSQMLAGPRPPWPLHLLMRLMIFVTFSLLPVLVLLYFQVKFLPSHDVAITHAHRVAILLDLALLFTVRPFIAMPYLRPEGRKLRFGNETWRWEMSYGSLGTSASLCLVIAAFSLLVATVPQGCFRPLSARTIDGQAKCFSLDRMMAGLWPEEVKSGRQTRQVFAPTAWLFEGEADRASGVVKSLFSRNLIVTDKDLVEEEDFAAGERSLQLRGRDLRFAVLDRSDLRHADLFGSNLSGASAVSTRFDHADFNEAQLEQAYLYKAQFNAAILVEARLPGAYLVKAQLRSAELSQALLDGVNLKDADLRDATTVRARFREADLTNVRLEKADLSAAEFQGAKLLGAHYGATNLTRAKLQGASLSNTELQGANFLWAQLQGANLINARMQGMKLSQVDLRGAYLHGVRLQGAELVGVSLDGATLVEARLQGANLQSVKLKGANLRGADLRGARLTYGVELQGANLRRARLQGADLSGAQMQGADLSGAEVWQTKPPLLDRLDLSIPPNREFVPVGPDERERLRRLINDGKDDKQRAALEARLGPLLNPEKDTVWAMSEEREFWAAYSEQSAPDSHDLSDFLIELACEEEGSRYIVDAFALRALHRDSKRGSYAVLTGGKIITEPACAADEVLSEETRNNLKRVAGVREPAAKAD